MATLEEKARELLTPLATQTIPLGIAIQQVAQWINFAKKQSEKVEQLEREITQFKADQATLDRVIADLKSRLDGN